MSQSLEARIQEFTLSNGLHFIVLERHIAPIVSCHTYADVGAFDEVDGQTGNLDSGFALWTMHSYQPSQRHCYDHAGIAHLLEHMAFKGECGGLEAK